MRGWRLNRRRWARVRRQALDAGGWRCAKCGKAGALTVDHVVSLQAGGAPFDLANLQVLCRADHWTKTSDEMGYRQPGPEQRAWAEYLKTMT